MWSVCLVFCDCGFHSIWWIRLRGLWKFPGRRDWLWGKLGLVLMGGAMLIESSIQFSVDGWSCVPSLLFDLSPNYGGVNEDIGHLLQKVPCACCLIQFPWHCSRPPPIMPLLDTPRHSQASLGSASCGINAPFSWVLMHTRFCLCPPRICFPSPV